MPKKSLRAAMTASFLAFPAFAMDGSIMVEDSYARSASPGARTGAAFMMVLNNGDEDDRLIAVRSDAAQRVEFHTHIADPDGVMRMIKVEDGIPVPAGGMAILKRGGDHVMFMGLNQPFLDGETVPVTLTFEKAGEVEVDIPVDLERQPDEGAHGTMTDGAPTN